MFQKICNKCFKTKYISHFYKQEKGLYGVTGECKQCRKERSSIFRACNKDQKNKTDRQLYMKNQEEKKAYHKNWRLENPDYMKAYREKTKLRSNLEKA